MNLIALVFTQRVLLEVKMLIDLICMTNVFIYRQQEGVGRQPKKEKH